MPRYTYDCDTCGLFDESRPMAAYADPCACPHCGQEAPRAMSAARIGGGSARGPVAAAPSRRHSAGCGCCTPRRSGAMRAQAVAAGAPQRGPAPASGSFLTRD